MFLLPKLGEVSRLFPEDVKRTREFLLDRGIPAGSLAALTHFSARLAIDPSFQRDVTSLVQVVIRRKDEAVDYMDLLGILVVSAAGAGPFHANDDQEESVREILRFLTQIRRPTGAVDPVFVRSQNVVPLITVDPLAGERALLPVLRRHDVPFHPVSSVPFFRMEASESSRSRGAAVWIAGGMALAIALGSGWMLYQRGQAAPPTTAASRIVPSSNFPVNEKNERTPMPARRIQEPQAPAIQTRPAAVARHFNASRAPLAAAPMTDHAPTPGGDLRPLDTGLSVPPAKVTSPSKSDVLAGSIPVTRPLTAGPESAAKSTAPVNTAASIPSLRRRLPKSIEINPPPLRRPRRSSESLDALASGVVHPASIGMMASNLISSPAPAYPAAASQAQVQGEVTVRAVVDREGNVTDARVVSGPELLRDVSLEAVQHWRYRPHMQGGQAVEVATTAILDFELP